MLCSLCPNNCNVDRSKVHGRCGVFDKIKIAKYYLHPFEEPIISGKNGSGTIFFCGCSLKCVFCQNYELSRNLRGKEISIQELADIFKELERIGATNINLVSPTHYADIIIEALKIYRPKIPICYNSHGYESIETLKKLNEYIDIYLPDCKYYLPNRSKRYSGIENYFEVAYKAIKFMIDSKPRIIENGVLKQGVIVRHLILPQNLDETRNILVNLKPIFGDAYLSLMSQYTPFGNIEKLPELKRGITKREYDIALSIIEELGYENVFTQDFSSQSTKYIPCWDY